MPEQVCPERISKQDFQDRTGSIAMIGGGTGRTGQVKRDRRRQNRTCKTDQDRQNRNYEQELLIFTRNLAYSESSHNIPFLRFRKNRETRENLNDIFAKSGSR